MAFGFDGTGGVGGVGGVGDGEDARRGQPHPLGQGSRVGGFPAE